MASEQPFKKRRRYEQLMAVDAPQVGAEIDGINLPLATSELDSHTQAVDHLYRSCQEEGEEQRKKPMEMTPPSELASNCQQITPDMRGEKLRKKRNREEIASFYKAYRRVKMCLTRHDDPAAFGVKLDLEAAYHSMIELSIGIVFLSLALDNAGQAVCHKHTIWEFRKDKSDSYLIYRGLSYKHVRLGFPTGLLVFNFIFCFKCGYRLVFLYNCLLRHSVVQLNVTT